MLTRSCLCICSAFGLGSVIAADTILHSSGGIVALEVCGSENYARQDEAGDEFREAEFVQILVHREMKCAS